MSQKEILLFWFREAEALLASTACEAVSVPDRGEIHEGGGGHGTRKGIGTNLIN